MADAPAPNGDRSPTASLSKFAHPEHGTKMRRRPNGHHQATKQR